MAKLSQRVKHCLIVRPDSPAALVVQEGAAPYWAPPLVLTLLGVDPDSIRDVMACGRPDAIDVFVVCGAWVRRHRWHVTELSPGGVA